MIFTRRNPVSHCFAVYYLRKKTYKIVYYAIEFACNKSLILTVILLPVCSTEAFSPERGAREGATKVMIVVTDGESHDGEELPDALKECEDRNITRYAIAVSLSGKCACKGNYILVLARIEHLRINTGHV